MESLPRGPGWGRCLGLGRHLGEQEAFHLSWTCRVSAKASQSSALRSVRHPCCPGTGRHAGEGGSWNGCQPVGEPALEQAAVAVCQQELGRFPFLSICSTALQTCHTCLQLAGEQLRDPNKTEFARRPGRGPPLGCVCPLALESLLVHAHPW